MFVLVRANKATWIQMLYKGKENLLSNKRTKKHQLNRKNIPTSFAFGAFFIKSTIQFHNSN